MGIVQESLREGIQRLDIKNALLRFEVAHRESLEDDEKGGSKTRKDLV